MKISRRDFIHAGCAAGAVSLAPHFLDRARAGINNPGAAGATSPSSFNGGRSQVNFNVPNGTGEYPFANLMKASTRFFSGTGQITPDICDANGWPTSYPGGMTSVNYAVNMPTQNERSGNYDLSWTGTGVASFILGGGLTIISGSFTPSGGFGHVVIIPNDPTQGNGPNALNIDFNGPHQNVQFCHVSDLPALSLNPNEFHPQFMAVNRALNFGVLRFLNWINGNQGAGITDWASRMPVNYWSFQGVPAVASLYAGASSASGSDLSVGLPPGGFSLADKTRLQYLLSAAPPVDGTATFTNGSQNVGFPSHGLSVGNQVYFRGTPATGFSTTPFPLAAAPIAYFVVNVIDANTVKLSATKGGTAITAGSGGSCSINPYLTISVNGGAAIPVWNNFSVPFPQSFINYPGSGFRILIYDTTFGAFIDFNSGDGNSSVPPEVCLDLCYKLRAHPWFVTPFMAMDPVTDWNTQLGNFIKTNYQNSVAPWMIPRFEPPNELWNTFGTNDTQYAQTKSAFYGWTGNPGAIYNWYGKVASIGGQQLANVFGGANLGTKYHWIAGVNTAGNTPSGENDRVASTDFLTIDPNPVQTNTFGGAAFGRYAAAGGGGGSPQNWVSHIAPANYFGPLERYTCQDLIDGFAYSVTNAGNPTAQAALANSYVDTCNNRQATVTVTNGSPNITWTAHGLSVNYNVVFMTAPPAGFTLGLTYFVKTVVDANTIILAATQGGAAITPTGGGSPILAFSGFINLAFSFSLYTQFKAWAAGFGISGMVFYEGGYSPDYLTSIDPQNASWSTDLAAPGATKANPCVLTVASTSQNPERSGITGNPAVVGMAVVITGVAGMTQLNQSTSLSSVTFTGTTVNLTNSFVAGQAVYFSGSGLGGLSQFVPAYVQAAGLSGSGFRVEVVKGSGTALTLTGSNVQLGVCYAITNVAGNQITLNVDSTAFSTYTSGGSLIYIGSKNFSNALRGAGKSAANLQAILTQNYTLITTAGGAFPSCFQLGGSPPVPGDNIWSILTDVYQPFSTSAQARAIAAFNN